MFFLASKLIEWLLTPSGAIIVLAVAGLVLLIFRRNRPGTFLLAAASVLLVAFGALPIGAAALMPLENRFPRPDMPPTVSGIVFLGGAVDTSISTDRGTVALTGAAERVTATAELARRYPKARIIVSSGPNSILPSKEKTEASLVRSMLVGLGVDPARIVIDPTSRNTIENAEHSVRIARPALGETWLLVTSASHMPRSVGCFRKVGFDVLPYPVDYKTRFADLWHLPRSIAGGLALSDLAAHEWIGLIAYHLLKGTELFPGPAR